ncbi:MAG: Oxygen tolerance [Acidobacteria bacterium]|nr:Oxygen tolerance [Acidobacteriota bacterium]
MNVRFALLALISFAFSYEMFGQQQVRDFSRSQASEIAPGFAIVTELSADRVYLGQQFSILYSLEAAKPPVAVDIDPQQFSGFWSEIAPLKEGESNRSRAVGARGNYRYLLRQVVAYPLIEGSLQLPPLQVKIKTSLSSSQASDGWDIIKASDPPKISVIYPLKEREPTGQYPLVGSVEGKISKVFRGGRTEASLELWGSVNLDLFRASQWVRSPENVQISMQLIDKENTVQTQDIGGKRSVSLLQRRRWSIRSRWKASGEPQIMDIHLPFFDVQQASWKTKLIEGIGTRSSEGNSNAQEMPPAPQRIQDPQVNGPLLFLQRYLLWIACLFALIITLATIRFLRRMRAP